MPANPHDLYRPIADFPGADQHGSTWAPARFTAEQSETAFMVEALTAWLEQNGDHPFFVHASFIRPHPPRRNPLGYHDLYDADDMPPFVAAPTKAEEAAAHPLNQVAHVPARRAGAPEDERERRQLRATYHGAQKEVDDQLARLFDYLDASGLADSTLVVLTSDHGEMGGDHWLIEKLGYWDESFHVPLIIRDPDPAAAAGPGPGGPRVHRVGRRAAHHLHVAGHRGAAAGRRLRPAAVHHRRRAPSGAEPDHWRTEAHWSWNFSNPPTGWPSSSSAYPWPTARSTWSGAPTSSTCSSPPTPVVLPPLLFDLAADPGQLHDLVGSGERLRARVAGRPTPAAVADAQRRAHPVAAPCSPAMVRSSPAILGVEPAPVTRSDRRAGNPRRSGPVGSAGDGTTPGHHGELSSGVGGRRAHHPAVAVEGEDLGPVGGELDDVRPCGSGRSDWPQCSGG